MECKKYNLTYKRGIIQWDNDNMNLEDWFELEEVRSKFGTRQQ